MGKTAKIRKSRSLASQQSIAPSAKKQPVNLPTPSSSPTLDFQNIVSPKDLAVTINTLNLLKSHGDALSQKEFKSLRAAVHSFYSVMTTGVTGVSLSGRVSDALRDGRYLEAISLLEEMRNKGFEPKLGAIQRWVRDCDAASTSCEDPNILRALDAIIRTTDPKLVEEANSNEPELHPIRRQPAWKPVHAEFPHDDEPIPPLDLSKFRVILHEKGSDRRPPNKHDAILYTSLPGTIKLTSTLPVEKHPVPNVPGAFVLSNVLSRSDCSKIISAAETIGFMPDQPADGTIAADSPSVLAHNVFWLADSELNDKLFERCKEFLPEGSVGINARWRVYRYVPGSVYRPHIDGAWPGSGIDPNTGEYVYDAFGDRWSKMTFLIRLNDGFKGGETTYFIPAKEPGFMNARGVLTSAGSVVCFPHGVARGSLLHEGSAVLEGKKYVIRTDVLFKLK